jgi:hypothetical protein
MFHLNPILENENISNNGRSIIDSEKLKSSKGFNIKKAQLISTNHSSQLDSPEKIKDFFMRKTESNFIKNTLSPLKKTRNVPFNEKNLPLLFNIMKTDIIQIDDMIKKFTGILLYYKSPLTANPKSQNINLNSSLVNLNKRIFQIEKNSRIDVIDYFEKISQNSQNLAYLYKDFNCKNKEELICRLAHEIYFNNLFISKTRDLIFLVNLTYNKENEVPISTNFIESHSKFSDLKFLLEILENKKICKCLQSQSLSNSLNLVENLNPGDLSIGIHETLMKTESEDDVLKVLEFNVISDLVKFNTKNVIIKHIKYLFSSYNDKAFNIISSLVHEILQEDHKNQHKIRKSEELIENFIMIRKILDDIYKSLIKTNTEMNSKITVLEQKNRELDEKIKELEFRDMNKTLIKIEEENLKLLEFLKQNEVRDKNKFYEEIECANKKYESLSIKYEVLIEEKNYLEKQVNLLTQGMKKNSLISQKQKDLNESYECLLIEQFDLMKNSFVKKLINNSNEMNTLKVSYKKEINKLKEEKISQVSLKELFQNQIITVRTLIKI